MAELTYGEYMQQLKEGPVLIKTDEQPVYYKRPLALKDSSINIMNAKMEDKLKELGNDRETELVMKSFISTYKKQLDIKREYGSIFHSIIYDEANYLESCSVTTYAKNFNYMFDFGDCIDLVFSNMTGIDPKRMHRSIESVCYAHDISYLHFSRAWTTGEADLMKDIPVEMLYEIHPRLQNLCRSIIRTRKMYTQFPYFTDVNIADLDDLVVLQLVIQFQILADIQYFQSTIIEDYDKDKDNKLNSLLVSKGLSNLLIESQSSTKNFNFVLDLRYAGRVKIYPKQYEKFNILNSITTKTEYEIL